MNLYPASKAAFTAVSTSSSEKEEKACKLTNYQSRNVRKNFKNNKKSHTFQVPNPTNGNSPPLGRSIVSATEFFACRSS